MKITKIIFHLLTILALLGALGLGAVAALYLWVGGWRGYVYGGATQGYHYAALAIGAVLTAILLQIGVIVLKIRNRQDVKRDLRRSAHAITLLIIVPVAVGVTFLGGNPLFLLLLIGIIVVIFTQWW